MNTCPYCGSRGKIKDLGSDDPNSIYVYCSNNDCAVSGPFGTCEEEAVRKWNKLRYMGANDIYKLRKTILATIVLFTLMAFGIGYFIGITF